MKRLQKSSLLVAALFASSAAFAQLQDEKNVTITMDLQPVLQLKMEGPDNLEFTFDEISEYYAGITKYGATILKVSSSVTWDLWAAGLSNGSVGTRAWDNPLTYGSAGTPTNATNKIPVTALELRQFPANPQIDGGADDCDQGVQGVGAAGAPGSDYHLPFTAFNAAHTSIQGDNCIYAPAAASPYTAPTSTATNATEKYIAGGSGTDNSGTSVCGVAGGSYLLQAALGTSSYYYVIDYRIVPGLPVRFPVTDETANLVPAANVPSYDLAFDIANPGGGGVAGDLNASYAAPGVYTMYVKYILAEDQ